MTGMPPSDIKALLDAFEESDWQEMTVTVDELSHAGAREVIVTNTLPIGEDKQFPQLTVLSIAPLLADTIRAVFENGSVTGLFDGSA